MLLCAYYYRPYPFWSVVDQVLRHLLQSSLATDSSKPFPFVFVRRYSFGSAPIGYYLSVYNLLDLDGYFKCSKGIYSIPWIFGWTTKSQGRHGIVNSSILEANHIILIYFVIIWQEMNANGGLSDQQFYCGPAGTAFEYNEFVLPYVGVAIMFFSVVYSRYEKLLFI